MGPEAEVRSPATGKLRFTREMRIRRGKDFQRVFREGSRAKGSAMTVAVAPNGLGHSRLGLSIGKAAWKRAVKRNRLRRIVREAFRLSYRELPRGLDVVVVGSVKEARPSLALARRELVALTRKAFARFREKGVAELPPEATRPHVAELPPEAPR